MIPAHEQKVTRTYWVAYPAHPPRAADPHYKDFEEYRRRTKDSAQCARGLERGDFSECSLSLPLELHHAHVEFSLQNGVDLAWLEKDYPGISDPGQVGAWIESAANLAWYCEFHHRGAGGVHVASAADWEAEKYVRGLIVPSVPGGAAPGGGGPASGALRETGGGYPGAGARMAPPLQGRMPV